MWKRVSCRSTLLQSITSTAQAQYHTVYYSTTVTQYHSTTVSQFTVSQAHHKHSITHWPLIRTNGSAPKTKTGMHQITNKSAPNAPRTKRKHLQALLLWCHRGKRESFKALEIVLRRHFKRNI